MSISIYGQVFSLYQSRTYYDLSNSKKREKVQPSVKHKQGLENEVLNKAKVIYEKSLRSVILLICNFKILVTPKVAKVARMSCISYFRYITIQTSYTLF